MENFGQYDIKMLTIGISGMAIIACLHFFFRSRLKKLREMKELDLQYKQAHEEILKSVTADELKTAYGNLKNLKDSEFLYIIWCGRVAERLKEMQAEIGQRGFKEGFEKLEGVLKFFDEVFKILTPLEQKILNSVTNELVGTQIFYAPHDFSF